MEQNAITVTSPSGLHGQLTSAWPAPGAAGARVHLDNGKDYMIPGNLLERQADGSYRLQADQESLERYQIAPEGQGEEEVRIIPVVEEQLRIDTRKVTTGKVIIRKTVREHTETIDHPLVRESVNVERKEINRILDAPAQIREEEGVLIIPVMEEVLVVEKKLLLREELHITRLREETHEAREYTLRAEEVQVERQEAPPASEQ
jgi:uncharacterized protein (TIGR02271 family)